MKLSKNKIIVISVIFLLIIFIAIFLILNAHKLPVYFQEEKDISEVQTTTNEDLLGTITIEKIDLIDAKTSEGTDNKTLSEFIGHFEESGLINGNIAFCSHNRGYPNGSYFARLNELENGDIILYKNITGEHKYIVNEVKEIKDTDVSVVENSAEDKITLITCVADKKNLRFIRKIKSNYLFSISFSNSFLLGFLLDFY